MQHTGKQTEKYPHQTTIHKHSKTATSKKRVLPATEAQHNKSSDNNGNAVSEQTNGKHTDLHGPCDEGMHTTQASEQCDRLQHASSVTDFSKRAV